MNNHSSSIRWRIVLMHYMLPLLVYIIALAVLSFREFLLNVIFSLLMLVGFVIMILTNKKKYLTAFFVADDRIEISYMNVLLKTKSLKLPLTQVVDVETNRPGKITQYPCALNLKYDNKRLTYPILSNMLDKEVKEKLNAVKLRA